MQKLVAALFLAALPCISFAAEEKNPDACQMLRNEIKQIEALQRQHSTPQLTERKKQVQKEMQELSCSMFDKKSYQ